MVEYNPDLFGMHPVRDAIHETILPSMKVDRGSALGVASSSEPRRNQDIAEFLRWWRRQMWNERANRQIVYDPLLMTVFLITHLV